ncbi:MAG: hypothetical protein K1X94_33515 [Sandaracinaceae bacterium]|nr:hypothetical protein [Sandaracinaceae bacterium]
MSTDAPDGTNPPEQVPLPGEPGPHRTSRRPRWPELLDDVREHPLGGIASARLPEGATIQGIPCAKGSFVAFHRNGRLSSATLARATDLDGEPLVAGTTLGLDEEGVLSTWTVTLTSDREVLIRSASGTTLDLPLVLPAGSRAVFEHRQLRTLGLGAAIEIDGVTFPAQVELVFGDSGALSHARSSEDLRVHGIPFAAHEDVVFLYGRLREGWLAADHEIDGIPCQRGEIVRFSESGRLARAFLSRDHTVRGVTCREGTRVYLDDEGRLLEGTLAEDATLEGIPVEGGSAVLLDGGRPILITPQHDCELDGRALLAGAPVELREGRPRAFSVARAETFAGLTAPRGSSVVLDEAGAPLLVVMTNGDDAGTPRPGTWSFFFGEDGSIRRRLPTDTSSRLDRVQLREAAEIDGVPAIERMPIELHEDGSLKSVVLARDHRVGGVLAKRGTRVHLHAGGALAHVTLAEDTVIGGIPCRAGVRLGSVMNDLEHRYEEYVGLHANGTVAFATLARALELDGVPLTAHKTIAQREDGSLLVGTLARDHTLPSGLVARAGTLFGRFADGTPSAITLAARAELGGVVHEAGAALTFREPGLLEAAHARVPLTVEPLAPQA